MMKIVAAVILTAGLWAGSFYAFAGEGPFWKGIDEPDEKTYPHISFRFIGGTCKNLTLPAYLKTALRARKNETISWSAGVAIPRRCPTRENIVIGPGQDDAGFPVVEMSGTAKLEFVNGAFPRFVLRWHSEKFGEAVAHLRAAQSDN